LLSQEREVIQIRFLVVKKTFQGISQVAGEQACPRPSGVAGCKFHPDLLTQNTKHHNKTLNPEPRT
jgi:hypothetical protein